MDDLISRKDILDEVETAAYGFWHHEVIRKAYEYLTRNIKAIPAVDAVEVVRCKDCKWLYDEMDDYCCRSHRGLVLICENSYCSYGERKEHG